MLFTNNIDFHSVCRTRERATVTAASSCPSIIGKVYVTDQTKNFPSHPETE